MLGTPLGQLVPPKESCMTFMITIQSFQWTMLVSIKTSFCALIARAIQAPGKRSSKSEDFMILSILFLLTYMGRQLIIDRCRPLDLFKQANTHSFMVFHSTYSGEIRYKIFHLRVMSGQWPKWAWFILLPTCCVPSDTCKVSMNVRVISLRLKKK